MSKGDVDIFQMHDKKTYTIKYVGFSFWNKIRFCLAILRNRKIVIHAKGKVKIINLTRNEIIKKMGKF